MGPGTRPRPAAMGGPVRGVRLRPRRLPRAPRPRRRRTPAGRRPAARGGERGGRLLLRGPRRLARGARRPPGDRPLRARPAAGHARVRGRLVRGHGRGRAVAGVPVRHGAHRAVGRARPGRPAPARPGAAPPRLPRRGRVEPGRGHAARLGVPGDAAVQQLPALPDPHRPGGRLRTAGRAAGALRRAAPDRPRRQRRDPGQRPVLVHQGEALRAPAPQPARRPRLPRRRCPSARRTSRPSRSTTRSCGGSRAGARN